MKLFVIIGCLLIPSLGFTEEPRTIEQNWNKYCKKCHGSDGTATKIGLRFKSPENIYEAMKGKSVEEILIGIREGKNKMPSFKKKLTEEEMKELALYIESLPLVMKMEEDRKINKELNNIQNL